MGYEPENTLRSFQKALDLGVDMIELDVYLCKTGELVVIHSDKLSRTTDGRGFVRNMSFKELEEMDAGKGEKIPSLQQVLDLIDKKTIVNIELKGPGTAKPSINIIEHYIEEKGWSYDNFILSSFNLNEVKETKTLNPQIKIGLNSTLTRTIEKHAAKVNPSYVSVNFNTISKKFIKNTREKGMKVLVWTVDKAADIEKMKALGVDGIISNFPDRI